MRPEAVSLLLCIACLPWLVSCAARLGRRTLEIVRNKKLPGVNSGAFSNFGNLQGIHSAGVGPKIAAANYLNPTQDFFKTPVQIPFDVSTPTNNLTFNTKILNSLNKLSLAEKDEDAEKSKVEQKNVKPPSGFNTFSKDLVANAMKGAAKSEAAKLMPIPKFIPDPTKPSVPTSSSDLNSFSKSSLQKSLDMINNSSSNLNKPDSVEQRNNVLINSPVAQPAPVVKPNNFLINSPVAQPAPIIISNPPVASNTNPVLLEQELVIPKPPIEPLKPADSLVNGKVPDFLIYRDSKANALPQKPLKPIVIPSSAFAGPLISPVEPEVPLLLTNYPHNENVNIDETNLVESNVNKLTVSAKPEAEAKVSELLPFLNPIASLPAKPLKPIVIPSSTFADSLTNQVKPGVPLLLKNYSHNANANIDKIGAKSTVNDVAISPTSIVSVKPEAQPKVSQLPSFLKPMKSVLPLINIKLKLPLEMLNQNFVTPTVPTKKPLPLLTNKAQKSKKKAEVSKVSPSKADVGEIIEAPKPQTLTKIVDDSLKASQVVGDSKNANVAPVSNPLLGEIKADSSLQVKPATEPKKTTPLLAVEVTNSPLKDTAQKTPDLTRNLNITNPLIVPTPPVIEPTNILIPEPPLIPKAKELPTTKPPVQEPTSPLVTEPLVINPLIPKILPESLLNPSIVPSFTPSPIAELNTGIKTPLNAPVSKVKKTNNTPDITVPLPVNVPKFTKDTDLNVNTSALTVDKNLNIGKTHPTTIPTAASKSTPIKAFTIPKIPAKDSKVQPVILKFSSNDAPKSNSRTDKQAEKTPEKLVPNAEQKSSNSKLGTKCIILIVSIVLVGGAVAAVLLQNRVRESKGNQDLEV